MICRTRLARLTVHRCVEKLRFETSRFARVLFRVIGAHVALSFLICETFLSRDKIVLHVHCVCVHRASYREPRNNGVQFRAFAVTVRFWMACPLHLLRITYARYRCHVAKTFLIGICPRARARGPTYSVCGREVLPGFRL